MLENKGIEHTYYYNIFFASKELREEHENENPQYTEFLSNLHITTFHSAKGLEFDTVIIPDFESYERYFIDFKKMKKEGKENNLKALNVALTRGKLNLYLVANKEISFLKDKNSYVLLKAKKEFLFDEFDDENVELPF